MESNKSETNKEKYFFIQHSETVQWSSGSHTLLKPNTQQMSQETRSTKPSGPVTVAGYTFWKQPKMSHFSFYNNLTP